jgi:hypothetical protein
MPDPETPVNTVSRRFEMSRPTLRWLFSRAPDRWRRQAVASCATFPCWRIRIALPNGSRTPMSVP